jgi:AraC-like DNA-binding protein
MHAFQDESFRRRLYAKTLRQELHRVEQGHYCLKVPRLIGLWDTRSKLPIYPTPEIFFQIGGQTDFALPHEKFTLKPCEVVIVPRGIPHRAHFHDAAKPSRTMTGMFLPDCFSFHIAVSSPQQEVFASPLDRFQSGDHIRLARFLDDIAVAHEELGDPRHPHIRGLLMAYLALVIQCVEPSAHRPRSEDPPLIRRCRQRIHSELANPELSVIWLARQLGCSRDHLSRAFHQHGGMRLSRYIEQCRLEQAVELLETSDLKIAAIAWTSGFSSLSYFDRIFMKLRGTTPKALREGSHPTGEIG